MKSFFSIKFCFYFDRMKVLFVSGIIMVNLFISAKYGIHCIWEQMWKMNKFMDSAADVKIVQVS